MRKHKSNQKGVLYDALHEMVQKTEAPVIAFLHDTGDIIAYSNYSLNFLSIALEDIGSFKLIPEEMEPQVKLVQDDISYYEKINLLHMTLRLRTGKQVKSNGQAIVLRMPSNEGQDTLFICSLNPKYKLLDELFTGVILDAFWSPQLLDERRVMRQLINTVPGMMYWKDRSLRYVGCNELFARRHNISIGEIVGKTESEIEQDRVVASHAERVDRDVVTTGQMVYNSFEPYIVQGDTVEWVKTQHIPIVGDNKAVIGVLGWIEDASDQMKKNIEISMLKERNRLLESLINSSIYSMVSWIETDDGLQIQFVSDSISRLGIESKRLRNHEKTWFDYVHFEDREAVLNEWQTMSQKQDEFTLQYRIVDEADNLRPIKAHMRALRSLSGILLCYEGTLEEIIQ